MKRKGPISFRVAYLREVWRRLGLEYGSRGIVIFGAGRHTEFLLERVADVAGPRVVAILDDEPRPGLREIAGIAVRRPGDVEPSTVGAALVSSDSIEIQLAARAESWSKGGAPVIRLYAEVPAGPYRGDTDLVIAHAGAPGFGTPSAGGENPHTAVNRIAHDPGAGGGELPIPPQELRAGYVMPDATYLAGGAAVAEGIRGLLRSHGATDIRRVMEWGCSTGRVLRHWVGAAEEVWGCDVDGDAIAWGAVHLAPQIRVFQNTLAPTFPVADGSFDLVYAISVLTHISHEHDAWLMELRRIVRPGGWVFVTINDENVWARCAREPSFHIAKLCPRLDFSQPLEDDFVNHGFGVHAQSFWHTRGVRARWSRFFEVVDIRPEMVDGVQTGVVMRVGK
jgi:SAM-dependent methyltransferase